MPWVSRPWAFFNEATQPGRQFDSLPVPLRQRQPGVIRQRADEARLEWRHLLRFLVGVWQSSPLSLDEIALLQSLWTVVSMRWSLQTKIGEIFWKPHPGTSICNVSQFPNETDEFRAIPCPLGGVENKQPYHAFAARILCCDRTIFTHDQEIIENLPERIRSISNAALDRIAAITRIDEVYVIAFPSRIL